MLSGKLFQPFSLSFRVFRPYTFQAVRSLTMVTSETNNELPPVLKGNKPGTFVWDTIKERWPTIVSKLVNYFHMNHREFATKYGPDAGDDVKNMLAFLSELRYRMMTNKPLEPFADKFEDVEKWNKLLQNNIVENEKEGKKAAWYDNDWLFVECYLYRKIFGEMYNSKAMPTFDYFSNQKQESLEHHKDQVIDSLVQLKSYLSSSHIDANDVHLTALIKQCIWGNRCDLSLSAGEAAIHDQSAEALAALDNYLIVNDTPKILRLFKKIKNDRDGHRRVDIVLDNAGMELLGDMILAEFLLASQTVDQVVIHMKRIPWFVSDVIQEDWNYTVETVKKYGDLGAGFGRQMERRVQDRSIVLGDHLFWTSPHRYCEMQQAAPDLYKDLGESRLIIFKGDLNYRKLVGDRAWPYTTPFKTALQGFQPAPLLALRTLKAETVAGLSEATVHCLLAKFKDSNEWMVTGSHAVIQFHE